MIKEICFEDFENLVNEAKLSPKKTSRICIHQNKDKSPQEMVICHLRESSDWPHRNSSSNITISVLRGCLNVVLFDTAGGIDKVYSLDGNKGPKIIHIDGRNFISPIFIFAGIFILISE